MLMRKGPLRLAGATAALALALTAAPGLADDLPAVKRPDCAALLEFVVGLDAAERLQPVEGSRASIPRAFAGAAFERLFGVPALDWPAAEARAMANHLFACGTAAGEAGRNGERTTFYRARRHFQSDLRGVLIARDRAGARAGADAARDAEEEPERRADRAEPAAPRAEEAAAAAEGRPDCRAVLGFLRGLDPAELWQPIEGSRQWIPRAFEGAGFARVFGRPALAMAPEDAAAIAGRIYDCGTAAGAEGRRDDRRVFFDGRRYFQSRLRGVLIARDRAAERARRDAERAAERARQRAEREAERAARAAERRAEEAERRAARRAAEAARRADSWERLETALEALLAQEPTLRLVAALDALAAADPRDAAAANAILARYGPDAADVLAYARRLEVAMSHPRIARPLAARRAEVREAVIADFAARIEALHNSGDGLHFAERLAREIERRVAPVLAPEATARITGLLEARREEIRADIQRRIRERIDAIARRDSSARARIAAIGQAVSRLGPTRLGPGAVAVLRHRAEARQAALAGPALDEARAALARMPETLEGLATLLADLAASSRAPLDRAPAPEREAYSAAAEARLADIAGPALAEFEARLAELPETRQGLERSEATLVSDPDFAAMPDGLAADFRRALAKRQAEIRTSITEARAASRRRAVAAGGDPDLVGHRFADADTGLAVAFLDERRVLLTLNGKHGITTYRTEGDTVLVDAPSVVLTFDRRGTGAETRLKWLRGVLTRTAD